MTRDSLLPPGFELCYANHDFRLALPSALAAERRRAALDRAERERSQPHVEEPPAEHAPKEPAFPDAAPPGFHRVLPEFDRVIETFSVKAVRARTGDLDARERLVAIGHDLKRRGPDRRIAVPDGWRGDLDQLEASLPHFGAPITALRHALALAEATETVPKVTPMLLLGPPGIGKSYFSQRLAQLLGAPCQLVAFDQPSAGAQLRGSDKYWGNSEAGVLFNLICRGEVANPVVLLDEIDKSVQAGLRQGDPLAQLHAALEEQTARRLRDVSVDVEFDASLVVYIATANSLAGIGLPLLSRFDVFAVRPPTPSEAVEMARELVSLVLRQLSLDGRLRVHRRVHYVLARMTPRLAMRTFRQLVAQAVHEGRDRITDEEVWAVWGGGDARLH